MDAHKGTIQPPALPAFVTDPAGKGKPGKTGIGKVLEKWFRANKSTDRLSY
ncbi:hypothetical protein CBFG_04629 [Clostridiales bacterium 1_7_47FAA]|nr:hypothetical protein CBFG_04629 [Clostridiales bacterium 1_7_47FAA]